MSGTRSLQGLNVSGTYRRFLQVPDAGADGTLRDVCDGEGDILPLRISTAGVEVTVAPATPNSVATKDYVDTAVSGGGGGGATDLSYDAVTRVIDSSTGTGATLPLVGTTDAGLVPATGGGVVGFLRADATFAAPPTIGRAWPSGSWATPPVSAIAITGVVTINTLYLSPFPLFRGGATISEIGVRVVTGSAGNMKAGLFEYDEATDQFDLLSETAADVSTASAGWLASALASSVTVDVPRLLWVGTVYSGTPVMSQWAPSAAGSGMQSWVAIPNVPTVAIANNNSGFGRVTQTAALTYVPGSPFMPASIAYSGLTFASAAPGSPVAFLRRA